MINNPIREKRYIENELELELIDAFVIALRLLGYHVRIELNIGLISASIRFTKDPILFDSLMSCSEVLFEVLDGEVCEIYARIKNEIGVLMRFKYECGSKPMSDVLDEILIYI